MQAAMAFMVQRMETGAPKTEEIMARFRPIAPKPPAVPGGASTSGGGAARKRSRQEEDYYALPPCQLQAPVWWPAGIGSPAWGMKMKQQGPSSSVPTRSLCSLPVPAGDEHLVALSLGVPGAAPPPPPRAAAVPVEHDLFWNLQPARDIKLAVITPRPARPLRTTICIDSSSIVAAGPDELAAEKTAAEVVAAVEEDGARPAVVSGCGDRVLLVNDAYKAMVGQPVCPWLDILPGGAGGSRRINGETVLKVQAFRASSSSSRPPKGGGEFPCTARITWELDGGASIASLTVPCAVERLADDDSGECRSIWWFDSTRASIIYCIS